MSAIDIPNPGALVARAGNEELSVPGKVERVDFLIVARQEMLDSFFRNVPDLRGVSLRSSPWKRTHPDLPIFCARREVFPVGTETYAPDIQVARL